MSRLSKNDEVLAELLKQQLPAPGYDDHVRRSVLAIAKGYAKRAYRDDTDGNGPLRCIAFLNACGITGEDL
jgi:hypothetical protein